DVAADDVALPYRGAADRVAARDVDDHALRVAEHARPGDVRADVVALDHIARRAAVDDVDAIAVAADDVAPPYLGPADRVPARADQDGNTGPEGPVAERERASDVGADVIALNDVAAGPAVTDDYAIYAVATNDVESPRCCATNGVTTGATGDDHA